MDSTALPQFPKPMSPKTKLPKTVSGIIKVQKLLRVRTLGALEKSCVKSRKG